MNEEALYFEDFFFMVSVEWKCIAFHIIFDPVFFAGVLFFPIFSPLSIVVDM
jgi:hypothetical protein